MTTDPVRTANKILCELIKRSTHTLYATRDKDLYYTYLNDYEIQNAVDELAADFEVIVRRYGEAIYLIPTTDNTYLGFTRTDLRQKLCTGNSTQTECDLAMFIILLLFAEMYDGKGRTVKGHDFITLSQFKNLIGERLKEGVSNISKEDEAAYGISYRNMYDRWESLKPYEDGQRMTRTTKDGFVIGIIRFLKEQGLMEYVEEDDQIRSTTKADVFMEQDILDKTNFSRIQEIINGFEGNK